MILRLVTFTFATLIFVDCYAVSNLQFKIVGIPQEMLTNVQARITVEQNSYGENLDNTKIQHFYKDTPRMIREALEPYGYFKSHVKSSLVKQNKTWIASYVVTLGQPIRIHSIDLKIAGLGEKEIAVQAFLKSMPLKKQMIFSTSIYQKVKDDLLLILNNAGYIKSFFIKNLILIDLKHYHVDVIMYVDTGKKYTFGKFTFGKNPYASSFLQRMIVFKDNETFSSKKLTTLQERMNDSPYFDNAIIIPDFQHINDNKVPVQIDSTVPPSQKYKLGVGYGTFTGPRLSTAIHLRRLTDTGHYLDAQIKLSSIMSDIMINYNIPGENPLIDKWVIGGNAKVFTPKNGYSQSGTVSLSYINKIHKWQSNLNLNYLLDRYSVINLPTRKSTLLYPGWNLAYVRTNDPINPTEGKLFNLTLRGTLQQAFSSTRFLQGEIKGKYLFSPTEQSQVILRGDLGYTAVHDLKALPLTMRFFAGGLTSIRGFQDSGIGPGKNLETLSIEYQYRLRDPWKVALFYDAGNASNKFGSPFVNRSQGVGIIYQSIIGPLKIYLAQAVSHPDRPKSIEFSMGPEF